MKCHAIEKRLSAYQDGELPASGNAEISRHLADCASCRETYEKFLQLWQKLDDLQPIPAPPGFYRQVYQRIHQAPEKGLPRALHWGSAWFKALPSSAVTATILLAGIVFGTYVGNSLARFQPYHGPIAFSEQSFLSSLKVFEAVPHGTLADGYERLMSFNQSHLENESRSK
jgi:anti-sigma factor RsiW